jgi:hypothetical protein
MMPIPSRPRPDRDPIRRGITRALAAATAALPLGVASASATASPPAGQASEPTFMSHEFQPGPLPTPVRIALADLDGDGRLELLSLTTDGGLVSVPIEGHRFGLPRDQGAFGGRGESMFAEVAEILTGDLDADGDTDVILVGTNQDRILVLHNDGDGALHPVQALAPGEWLGLASLRMPATALARGGRRDGEPGRPEWLAAASPAGVLVMPVGADGRLGPPSLLGGDPEPAGTSLAAGDLDGDGRDDLAFVVDFDEPRLLVALRGPNGGWSLRPPVPSSSAFDLLIDDLDGDGDRDLALAPFGAGEILAHPGRGDGTFGPPVVLGRAPGIGWLQSADLDADGRPDLVHAAYHSYGIGSYEGGRLTVLRGRTGGWPEPWYDRPGWLGVGHPAIGDLTGDGVDDIVHASWGNPSNVSVLAGRPDAPPGNLTVSRVLGEPRQYAFLPPAPGEVSDGLVVLNDAVRVMTGRGDGTFAAGPPQPVDRPLRVLDSVRRDDDRAHLIIARDAFDDRALVLLGRTGDAVATELTLTLPPDVEAWRGGAGDLDGDGDVDLVLRSGPPASVTVLRRGPGGLDIEPATLVGGEDEAVGVVRVADLDADGWLDAIAVLSTRIVLLAGGPAGLGEPAVLVEFDEHRSVRAVVVFDHDDDDLLDVLVSELWSGAELFRQVAPRTLASLGTLESPGSFVRPPAAAGDVDGDGDLDLVTSSIRSTSNVVIAGVGWYENRWNEGVPVPVLRADGPAGIPIVHELEEVRLLDVDADGRAEIAATVVGLYQPDGLVVSRRLTAPAACTGDLDVDGDVDFDDLLAMLEMQGSASGGFRFTADLDASGTVDRDDLERLLASWGPCRR